MEQSMTLDENAILPEDLLLSMPSTSLPRPLSPLTPVIPPLLHNQPAVGELDEFLQSFAGIFTRSDQMNRFRAYIHGLLVPGIRKNVGSLASAVRNHFPEGFDPSQALQHFVTSSPWPENDLAVRLKEIVEHRVPDPEAVWLLHEAAFEKRGKNSVGVQRQYSRHSGKKLNCQLAVILARVGASGYFPIAAGLYLPSAWLENRAGTIEQSIPENNRQLLSKAQVALSLLGVLGNESHRGQSVVVEASYLGALGFEALLREKGLRLHGSIDSRSLLEQGYRHFEWMKRELGIDHFEGRTWRGWHHHVHLVFAAFAFHVLSTREEAQ